MKGVSGLVALALLAATTGAHAQSGPVNHKGSAASAESSMMASPPPPPQAAQVAPPTDLTTQISQVRTTLRDDLDQRKIGRRKAAHLRREVKAIEVRAEGLNDRLARIAGSLP